MKELSKHLATINKAVGAMKSQKEFIDKLVSEHKKTLEENDPELLSKIEDLTKKKDINSLKEMLNNLNSK